jgi:MFS family permease
VIAGIALAAGAGLLTTITADTPIVFLLCAFGVFGIGLGLVNAPITNTAVSGMPKAQVGSAAAVASTSRQVGVSLGVAIAGTLAGVSSVAVVGPGFAEATHPVWWTIVGLACVIFALAIIANSARGQRSVDEIAYLLAEPTPTSEIPTAATSSSSRG